jgi:FkbM family methyltransferase
LGNLISWLFKQEPVKVVPVLDRPLAISIRILYIAYYLGRRLCLRLLLGKEKRDKLLAAKKISFNYQFESIPAFLLTRLIRTITKSLRLNNSYLLKITVPKYNYRAYCPANENDLINLTIREDEIIEKFCPREGDIVVDVGAHIGHYTLIAGRRVGPKGTVIAIEAHPKNYELLKRNIKLNRLTNVIALNYAVYSNNTKIKLYFPEEESVYSIYNTLITKRANYNNHLSVNARTLDEILGTLSLRAANINWIKIDVEGAELEVLKGARCVLTNNNHISLLIEIHRLNSGNLYRPLIELLVSYNFKIEFHRIHDSGERHVIARK